MPRSDAALGFGQIRPRLTRTVSGAGALSLVGAGAASSGRIRRRCTAFADLVNKRLTCRVVGATTGALGARSGAARRCRRLISSGVVPSTSPSIWVGTASCAVMATREQGSISTSPPCAARGSSRPAARLMSWPSEHGAAPRLEQDRLQPPLQDAGARRQHEMAAVVACVGDHGPACRAVLAVDGDVEGVGRADQRAEQRPGIGHLADAALQALVERGEHAGIEAGADHQQERLAVGLGAGDRGDRPFEQHGGDGRGRGGKPDLVGQHVAGADGDDAERRVGADQGGCDVADGAVAAGRDDGVVAAALGGLACGRAAAISAGGGCTLTVAPRGASSRITSSTSGDAGDAGARIGDQEEAAAHVGC